MAAVRLSVLDQAPVPAGFTPSDALANSLDLARHVEALGYTRLWYSEHHAMDLLACTAPEILIARAAGATERIRVGSGGIMLPHYSALKVAEVFRTLHAMFPGRIDLGIGRAGGGMKLATHALRRTRYGPPESDFPEQLAELRAFLHPERFELKDGEHPFGKIRVAPDAPGAPDLWLLGSSLKSAVIAAQEGLPYAYAHFFSAGDTRAAIEYYLNNFRPAIFAGCPASDGRQQPEAAIAIGVICAPTQDEAEHLHASVRLMQRRKLVGDRSPLPSPEDAERELAESPGVSGPEKSDEPEPEWPQYIVGTPDSVAARLRGIADGLRLNEIIVNTITHSHEARRRSYTLLAEAMGIGG